ncbi:MAG: hypothetical protein QW403_02245 [Candidatus Aenigmatarchaeota archaeon]
MELLSEREIDNDLKRKFPGEGIRICHLFKAGNPFFAQNKEEAIIGYTCGYSIREFLLRQKFRLTFSAIEMLPIVFNVYGAKELYEICGAGKGPQGIDDLKKIGTINYDLVHGRRIAFYVHNFENMKNNLKHYGYERGFLGKKFEEKFEEKLGSLKPYVNQISKRSLEVYEAAIKWYRNHKDLKDFIFMPKPLTLEVGIESVAIA